MQPLLRLAAAAALLLSCTPEPPPADAPKIGQPIALRFTAVDGSSVDLDALKGKVVLLDFWATWCEPCLVELPSVRAAYERLHARGFEIIGISSDNLPEKLQEFVRDRGLPWPQYCDTKGWKNDVNSRFGITGLPTMWLIDKEGKLSDTNAQTDLEPKVEKLLAQ